ncbi:hypothetical protein CONLIGDRAFT_73134 [Coniochaeta ligniaria NRRL 30616]|uniref:Nucleic acid-binding protein n=1 Tax=Coniochaeta ligniaria NRRL 30616 TaxID=1408157 RepID=A0A1J7J6T1_9PEZI|nr:hypothetical protein CONLIGDRAFT_73134 [Coniochaeta ligniaria NRRL 30616]
MAGKVLIFAGAPHSSSLNWDPAILLSEISESIARFARLPQTTPTSPLQTSSPSFAEQRAVWRSLPLERAALHSGFTQQHAANDWEHNKSDFFTTASVSFRSTDGTPNNDEFTNDLLSQFYEQSRAVHDQMPSSQLVPESQSTEEATTSFITDTSVSYEETSITDGPTKGPLGNHRAAHLSDLEDIPSASYLIKAQPATVTVNLIVGIISLSTPRAIKTRWGGTSSLVEVLVGDETRSGFAVTFWLPSSAVEQSELAGLRAQDVVLLQNVALNVFMKKVYGSSLRKGTTKAHLLYRRKLDRADVGGHYSSGDLASAGPGNPQLAKTRRVWEWVLDFVGTGPAVKGGRAPVRPWDRPPEDTQ